MAVHGQSKLKRRLGYGVLGLATMALTIPMIIGAIQGASSGEIWDPYTGDLYHDPRETCLADAEALIKEAGQLTERQPSWEDPYRSWATNCANSHPDVHRVLKNSREKLKAPFLGP